jgi:hypothetical protein
MMVRGECHSSLEIILQCSGEADVLKPLLPHCAHCEVDTIMTDGAVFHNPDQSLS